MSSKSQIFILVLLIGTLFIGSASISTSESKKTEFDSKVMILDDFSFDSDFEYPLMEFTTFLGGSEGDHIYDIVLDDMGNIYVAGATMSSDFPIKNAFQETYGGNVDAFLAKFSSDGQSLLFSTFFGGSGGDYVKEIALDPEGNILLSGWTDSSDFPIKNNLNRTYYGFGDLFITKFSPDGQSLLFSIPIGGSGIEWRSNMLVDALGNIFIIGETSSSDFPIINPFKAFINDIFFEDHFVTILSNDGETILLSSYIGGYLMGSKTIGMCFDVFGNLYIYGLVDNSDLPLVNSYDPDFNGGTIDGFLMKISAENRSLVYSTYLGGSGSDYITDVIIDNDGNLFVTGMTTSIDFPLINAFDTNYSGRFEGFISKFSPDGQSLSFSSYIGGSFREDINFIEIVENDAIIIFGETTSQDFPYLLNNQNRNNESSLDGFLTKISTTGEYLSGFKFGGSDYDEIEFI
ncbi:MAG: SBBP repeat-containing protein, partial [Candidatus Kariarchaeaceae archaeon]